MRDITKMRRLPALVTGIALAVFASAASANCELDRYATLPVLMVNGQPHVKGSINGAPAEFLADTGAFFNTMPHAGVVKYKLPQDALSQGMLEVRGVGGATDAGKATVHEFSLDGLGAARNVDFVVTEAYPTSLPGIDGVIGQNVLGYADAEFDLANGVIRLIRPKDCGGSKMAYWAGSAPVGVVELVTSSSDMSQDVAAPDIIGDIMINGRKVRADFDSGSSYSVMDASVLARAGIALDRSNATPGGIVQGIGEKSIPTWIVRLDVLDIGGEQIRNARVRVGDFGGDIAGSTAVTLGADFFLAHHIYVAASQHRLYFTYNGGRIFDLRAPAQSAGTAAPEAAEQLPADSTQDAGAMKRRGAALVSRQDLTGALAAFDRSIALDPSDAETYYLRAQLRGRMGKDELAATDLNAAIERRPDYVDALLVRGAMRLHQHDDAGANADFTAAVRSSPNDPFVALQIVPLYMRASRYDEAISRLDAWIAANPTNDHLGLALRERCLSRAMSNHSPELALPDCDGALKLDDNPGIREARATAELRLGKFEAAIVDFGNVLKAQPNNYWSRYGLGLAEQGKGAAADAARDMQAALAGWPHVADGYVRAGFVTASAATGTTDTAGTGPGSAGKSSAEN